MIIPFQKVLSGAEINKDNCEISQFATFRQFKRWCDGRKDTRDENQKCNSKTLAQASSQAERAETPSSSPSSKPTLKMRLIKPSQASKPFFVGLIHLHVQKFQKFLRFAQVDSTYIHSTPITITVPALHKHTVFVHYTVTVRTAHYHIQAKC